MLIFLEERLSEAKGLDRRVRLQTVHQRQHKPAFSIGLGATEIAKALGIGVASVFGAGGWNA